MSRPILFDEFFESGMEQAVSPFLTPSSRRWGRNLPLKASLLSALFLAIAFALSFFYTWEPLAWLLLVGVYFLAGTGKLIAAIDDLASLQVNIDVLMTLAAFASVLIGSPMEGGLLLVLFAISGSIEETVTSKAKSAVRSLHKLAPSTAVVIESDGRTHQRNIRDIDVGARILIKAGEVVPLDGHVVEGETSLNLAHLTGESLPVQKVIGDEVPAGATNLEGAVVVAVSHTSADSTLARIIRLITQAQAAKPKFQRWLDKVSRAYALSIIGLSFCFALFLPLITALPYLGFEGAIYRALAFLIAASPCALIIALPVAYLSAVSACARRGILLKGGVTLDALASCRSVAFDKTGTLTTGNLRCLGVSGIDGNEIEVPPQALGAAAALEQNAVHPIAQAIIDYARERNAPQVKLDGFRAIPGYGLEAKGVYIGHPDYLRGKIASEEVEKIRLQGQLLSVLLYDETPYIFRFQDTPREGVKETLRELRTSAGVDLLMLTGDHRSNAEAVAKMVGIDAFFADLRPEDKLEHVTRLSEEQGLAMIGDGINDGPALARATTGISMGRVGSRTAIDASDVVLLQDDLSLLSWLFEKAKKTQQIVKQNVALASVAIVGASVSALLGWVPLWLAVVLHEGSTVVVGLNSLRLLRTKNH
jgi:Zn2+/Cd2+-exporting ATPase